MIGWEADGRLPVGASFHPFALLPGAGCHHSMQRGAALARDICIVNCVDAAGLGM